MANTLKHIACAAAIGLAAFIAGCGPSKPVLNLYTWSDYIDENLVKEFEKQYNCKVVIDTFDSNEFMYAKLKAGGSGYDVIVPTSYMSKIMNDQKMLLKLDHSKLPNSKYIDKRYLDNLAIDKKMEYCIPYMLGYTCIAYNKEKLGDIPQTWEVFSNEKNKGRMTMLNDYRETIGAGLMFNGYSINTRNEKELEKAKENLNLMTSCYTDKDIRVRKQKLLVGALAGMLSDLDMVDIPEPQQPELPIFRNNDQRKEWLRDYKAWGLWYEDENIGAKYYKYDFENGARLIAETYIHPGDKYLPEHESSFLHLVGGPEPVRKNGISKWVRHEEYDRFPSNETELVEFLKYVQKEGK